VEIAQALSNSFFFFSFSVFVLFCFGFGCFFFSSLLIQHGRFAVLHLINGNNSVKERMPKGKGLLSSKDFALQVAEK